MKIEIVTRVSKLGIIREQDNKTLGVKDFQIISLCRSNLLLFGELAGSFSESGTSMLIVGVSGAETVLVVPQSHVRIQILQNGNSNMLDVTNPCFYNSP